MTISVADAGEYVEAEELYVAHDGEWVHVPLGGGGPAEWTRPDDWLDTTVTVGEQKVQCLVAVGVDATVEANRTMTITATPAFTVNWGDGTAPQNYASGANATHLYDPTALAGTLTSQGFLQALVTLTPQAGNLVSLGFTGVYYTGKTYRNPVVEIVAGPSTLNGFALSAVCPLLQRVELLSPLTLTSGTSLFLSCFNLHEIVGEVVITGSTLTSMFSACPVLSKFPTVTLTGSNINGTSMFSGCASMVEPPPFNTANITNFSSMFLNCTSLKRLFTGFDTPLGTNFASMFQACSQLEELPPLTTGLATNGSNMFISCPLIRRVMFSSTAAMTTVTNMFNGCNSLESVTGLDFSAVSSAANIATTFTNTTRLSELEFLAGKGPRFSFTLVGMLDTAQLDAIYTALPTITGQTITVTGLPGTLADTPTIATAKGWTVTGS